MSPSIINRRSSFQLLEEPMLGGSRHRHWWSRCWSSALWWRQGLEKRRGALVKKNGAYRMFVIGRGEHTSKFLADVFITMIDLPWPFLIASLFTIYLIIFLSFAVFWYLMAYNNGDLDNLGSDDHDFCLTGVTSFPSAIMFSMETQTTIGYGFTFPNSHCAATVPLMCLQVLVGLFLETLMLGSVFVKIARPKHRANTILFSKQALINKENGKLVLQVRVGDLRKSHLVDSFINGMVVHRYTTKEGVVYPLYQFNCQFTADGMEDEVFLLFPMILKHVIDEGSPLYGITPQNLASQRFELILYLTGTVESTGEMCQARTSYLPNEIFWDYRFARVEHFDARRGQWEVNFKSFNNVVSSHNVPHTIKQTGVKPNNRYVNNEEASLPPTPNSASPSDVFPLVPHGERTEEKEIKL